MENILKELNGKSMTKNELFSFLSTIDLKKLGKEIKCDACMKQFKTETSLKNHYKKNTVCTKWIDVPEKSDIHLTKGIHLILDDLLKSSISNGKLECKHCNTPFINTGNLHKHFNVSSVCNKLAYNDFKNLFSNLNKSTI